MTQEQLRIVLFLAGALHFTQVPAMFVTPRILDWNTDFTKLSPINRQIVKVVFGGIMLCVLGLGVVVLLSAEELASSRLGARLCGFLAIFWAYRAIVQLFVYSRIWPQKARWSHVCLSWLFPILALLYALRAFAPSPGS